MHRAALAAVACVAIAAVPTSAAAHTDADPLAVTAVEPLVGGKVVVERVAAGDAGQDERWRVNLDVWVRNSGTATAKLTRIVVGYPGAPVTVTETGYGLTIAPGKSAKIQVPESRVLPFPVAPSISVRLEFDRQTLFVNRALAEHRNPVAGGGYLFPGKRADLPDGWYWTDGQSHVAGSNHRSSSSQRFAYDFVVRRWNGKQWTSRKAGASGNRNENSLIWGLPVHAMADGWILRCGRSKADNVPGESTGGAGNFLRIVHATRRGRAVRAHAQGLDPGRALPEARRERLRDDGDSREGGPVPRARRQHRPVGRAASPRPRRHDRRGRRPGSPAPLPEHPHALRRRRLGRLAAVRPAQPLVRRRERRPPRAGGSSSSRCGPRARAS